MLPPSREMAVVHAGQPQATDLADAGMPETLLPGTGLRRCMLERPGGDHAGA